MVGCICSLKNGIITLALLFGEMTSALPKLQLKFSWKEPVVSCGREGGGARKVVETARKRDAQHARPRNEESGKQLKRKKTEENDTCV